MSAAEREISTSSSTRPVRCEQHADSDETPGRQCVLYYTNTNARYSTDVDVHHHHGMLPPFTADDPDEYYEDDDDDDDDDEGDNDDVEADDYIAVDEHGIGSGGSVIKLEDAAFVSCTGDFEVDTAQYPNQHAALQDDNDIAESFFDGGGGLPVILGGRRRMDVGSLQNLVGTGGRRSLLGGRMAVAWRSLLGGCCWYGPVTLRCFAACVRSRPFLFFIYVVLALVFLSSCVSVVLVGSLVARPYVRAKGFINTTCSPSVVSEGSRNGRVVMQTCTCGKGCNSKYRCIRIHVRYTPHLGAETTGVLYDDETALGRQVNPATYDIYNN